MAEDSISTFCKTLSSFCKHLETSSNALKDSLERRPIPLESASSTFIQCLNRRVSSASKDLNLLESMAFGTVSFEELLGHCNEVYKKNQSDLIELEDRFRSFGYVPVEIDDEDEVSGLSTPVGLDSKLLNSKDLSSFSCGPVSAAGSIMKRLGEDPLFEVEESLSLQNLGLSDVCLATLAYEANGKSSVSEVSFHDQMSEVHGTKKPYEPCANILSTTRGRDKDDPKSVGSATRTSINISKDDYERLPSYMKSLASWEDLHAAVMKMNSTLTKHEKSNAGNLFHQDELASMGLGPKGRSYLLLLLRMNRLVVETVDGSIAYRVL
ncbi:PREDICTED: uncharacterized protein LOC104601485 isoform X2 [Nelumbo nucifera]|uniref:Uncharacterized protein LOC104601485 isoform X2 n=1 Tax=Nelumbo nucifera TaxID=4432 RepID=A0A1U8ALA8_NELNU|nr:PREDICTED: uncharacterized protein LOC104601485 isoform X2 [Nelumbo nucifera]